MPASPERGAKSRLHYLLRHLDVTRGYTRRVAERIPVDRLDWSPAPGLPSIADKLRYIGARGRWVYVERALGRPPAYPGHGPELCYGREGILAFLDGLHAESLSLLRSMEDAELDRYVQAPNGAELPVWRWLQSMVEEEAQVRGQVELMLNLAGIPVRELAHIA
ncbi:MAG: DinB family protein [Acidobacteria bacterium]|nr:DinB family protein [Acidobacteriota bacterium]